MNNEEKLITICDLSLTAHNYILDAIKGVIETNEALRIADSLLTAITYVRNYENDSQNQRNVLLHNNKSTSNIITITYNGNPVPEKGEIWFSKEDGNFAYIYAYYLGNVYYFYIDGNTCAMYKISIQDFMESFERDKKSVNLFSRFRG